MNEEKIREAIRIQQAANSLGVHYTAIKQAIERGEIEAVRADGKVYVLVDSLHRYKPRPYPRTGKDRPKIREEDEEGENGGGQSRRPFTAQTSEPALSTIWDTPEEDSAWQHL